MLKRLLSRLLPTPEAAVIDQSTYWDASERRLREMRENLRQEELCRRTTALQIGSWARDTVCRRERAPYPPRMMREILFWLPGLTAQEIIYLSKAPPTAVRAHVYGDEDGRIAGVRAVQPLQHGGALVFPKPAVKPAEDMRDRSSGGGPKQRFA
jgi:hypothetical protein